MPGELSNNLHTSTPSTRDHPVWIVNDEPYVLHTITLKSSDDQVEQAISCILQPNLIPLLPDPLPEPQKCPQVPSFSVRETPNKGFGMFATRDIPAGELIAVEHPAIILPSVPLPSEAYDSIASQLPTRRREDLMSMANSQPSAECPNVVEGIVRTNAIVVQLKHPKPLNELSPVTMYGGLYPLLNRCNHSCGPNAAIMWNQTTLSGSLYALRPIAVGEEIFKTYVCPAFPRATRMATLEKLYHFRCDCPWCEIKPMDNEESLGIKNTAKELAQIANSDLDRQRLGQWVLTHPSYKKWSTDLCRSDTTVICSHLEALSLIDKEGMQGLQNLFIEELALCYAILGDETNFRLWGEKLVSLCQVEDPPTARKFEDLLIDPPKKFKRWGWRMKQRKEMSGRRRTKLEDLEREFTDDTFRLLFQFVE